MTVSAVGDAVTTGVVDVLSQLAELVEPDQRPAVAELIRRLRDNRFRILVVGEAKRGKSTLINALLGRDVLPVGAVPVTAISTTVTHGSPDHIDVRYLDDQVRAASLADLSGLVDERTNPGNRAGVEHVTVYIDAPIVRNGIELVDTPGTGSVYGHGDQTRQALQAMDAAILVLSADPPLSASERDLLAEVAAAAVHTFVILNKADQLEPGDLDSVVDFVTTQASSVLGQPPEVLCCSAREACRARVAGLDDVQSGLPHLETVVRAYLAAGRVAGLHESVRRKADQLIGLALDGLRIRLSLAGLEADEAERGTVAFRERLGRVRQRRCDTAGLVRVGADALLADLNEASSQAEKVLAADMVGTIRRWVDGPGAELTPARLRDDGRAYLAGQVRDTVDRWRRAQQGLLEKGLRRLEHRLLADLAADLAELADAARDLLGVDLAAPSEQDRLLDNPDFFYQLNQNTGWNELLTDTLLRRLGGRHRAVSELLIEADRLTRQQIGRVRADLQYRLGESSRAIESAVRERFVASAELLEKALSDAAHDRDSAAGDASSLNDRLEPRARQLRTLRLRLAELLNPAATPTGTGWTVTAG